MPDTNRPLPLVTPWNQFFWTSGRDGKLRFQRGAHSGVIQHPPQPVSAAQLDEPLEVVEVSGLGTVIGVTINRQTWHAGLPAPYVVAVVAIDEDQRVRLTTNLVNAADEQIRVGQRVRVVFEQVDDVWLPLFEPVPDTDVVVPPDDEPDAVARWHSIRGPASPVRFEESAALTGIGMSAIGRKLMVDPLSLTIDAARAAVADAGLDLDDIDGLSTYPAGSAEGGFSEGGVTALESALQLRPTWHNGGGETPGAIGAIAAAALAVHAGLCRHVLVFRTVWQATYAALAAGGGISVGGGSRAGGGAQWSAPFGSQPSSTVAMAMAEYFRRYGATREVLGWIAINARRNAMLNPTAVFREPLTMDGYLSARMITDPLCLLDCDPLCDGAVAVVVSAAESAADLPRPSVRIEAIGSQITERIEWDQGIRTHEPHVTGPAAHLWTRTDLRPADVDVAELYDGFSFNCLSWIEALGFCGPGEAQDFLDGGRTIARDGALPLNTHGGQLSHGRTHGMGLVHEAVTQLRHAAGDRQVPDATVAVTSSGGLTPGATMLLRRDS